MPEFGRERKSFRPIPVMFLNWFEFSFSKYLRAFGAPGRAHLPQTYFYFLYFPDGMLIFREVMGFAQDHVAIMEKQSTRDEHI